MLWQRSERGHFRTFVTNEADLPTKIGVLLSNGTLQGRSSTKTTLRKIDGLQRVLGLSGKPLADRDISA